jgi:hypothetical protein
MKNYTYGNFPTLKEIQNDYAELMCIIKDVRTVEEARDLEKQGFTIEINGVPINDYVSNLGYLGDGADGDIDWIRYESYGCLSYIYDRFDGAPVFSVWAEYCQEEFIADITIGTLTEKFYTEAINKYKDDVDPIVKQIRERFIEELVSDVVNNLHTNKFYMYDALNEQELRHIQSGMVTDTDYHKLITTDTFAKTVEEMYQETIDARVAYYTVKVPFAGEIEVVVKAHCEEDAEDYIHSMSHYDLSSYVDTYDIAFEEYDAYVERASDDEPFGVEIEDATE